MIVLSVIVSACTTTMGRTGKPAPITRPFPNAPVTVEITESALIISNNSEDVIYHVLFPMEILPRIEWAPCMEPDRCDSSLKIDAGEQKTYRLESVVDKGTEELVVFWWWLMEVEGGYEQPEIQEVRVPLY